jgi:hypothetical protein
MWYETAEFDPVRVPIVEASHDLLHAGHDHPSER